MRSSRANKRSKRTIEIPMDEQKGVADPNLIIQRAGILAYLDVELGLTRFHFLACQRIWTWASTPISAAISILSCFVAASETLIIQNSKEHQGQDNCQSRDSSFSDANVRRGVSFTLATLSTLHALLRPHKQLDVAREATCRVNELGDAYNQLCAENCSESNIQGLERIQRDLQGVRAEYSGPFMCVGIVCANVYLRLFTNDALLVRWRPIADDNF